MSDELDGTWCPECGPGVRVDADGCCTDCGADAAGPGSRRARVALAAEARLRGELECAKAGESAALEEVARITDAYTTSDAECAGLETYVDQLKADVARLREEMKP